MKRFIEYIDQYKEKELTPQEYMFLGHAIQANYTAYNIGPIPIPKQKKPKSYQALR
jgi:hypothetical protein